MIYKRLNEIPLNKFIDLYCGDLNTLIISGEHEEEELKSAAASLFSKYTKITNSKAYYSFLSKSNDSGIFLGRIQLMEMCLRLLQMGDCQSVSEILIDHGVNVNPKHTKELEKRIKSILGRNRFYLDKMNQSKNDAKERTEEEIRDDFEREITNASCFYRMNINDSEISAQRYANMIREMILSYEKQKKKK